MRHSCPSPAFCARGLAKRFQQLHRVCQRTISRDTTCRNTFRCSNISHRVNLDTDAPHASTHRTHGAPRRVGTCAMGRAPRAPDVAARAPPMRAAAPVPLLFSAMCTLRCACTAASPCDRCAHTLYAVDNHRTHLLRPPAGTHAPADVAPCCTPCCTHTPRARTAGLQARLCRRRCCCKLSDTI